MSRKLFQPGQSGNPAGRKPGSLNKSTLAIKETAKRLGVDPFEVVLLFAKGDWKALGYDSEKQVVGYSESGEAIEEYIIQPQLRAKCAIDAVQYLAPKLKSIEHTQEKPEESLTPQQRLEMMKAATQALENEINRLGPSDEHRERSVSESDIQS